MTTRTHTGGLKEFVYPKGHQQRRLTQEESLGVKEAYEKARIRKRKERIIKWGIIGLIILIVISYVWLK